MPLEKGAECWNCKLRFPTVGTVSPPSMSAFARRKKQNKRRFSIWSATPRREHSSYNRFVPKLSEEVIHTKMIWRLPPQKIVQCFYFAMCICGLVVHVGCTPTSDSSSSGVGDEKTAVKSPAVASLSDTPDIAPGSAADAKRMIVEAIARYRTLDRYADAGEIRIETPGSPTLKIPFRLAFERPNRLALASHNAVGTWKTATWEGICESSANPFPNQRLVRPLPDRIDYEWIVGDYLGGLLIEPIGIPIPLEWLLSPRSLEAVNDPTCKLELLQRDTAEERLCDRIGMEVRGLRWVFWIDRENQLVRRMELPPKLLYPGIPDERSANIRCEIFFLNAVANQPIDWSRWQIPERSEDVSVRRMVMPPPIASTQILGTKLEPFDLKSLDGTLLLDSAEPKRPISVLCWVDSGSKSESCVRELMNFRKQLIDQELGGRCGVFLIARKSSTSVADSLKSWNCDLPLAIDQQELSDSLFKISSVPSLVILDRDRRVQVAETISQPIFSSSIIDLVRRIDNKEDLASRQLQQDADNQARFIAALHRVAIDKDQIKRLDSLREFQFSLHGMRRAWRTQLDTPLVSAGGAWYPEAAISDIPKPNYPFAGTGNTIVMSTLDETGKILVLDDLGNKQEVGKVEIDQADGAQRIQMAIDPWSRKWIAIVPEGLPRFWINPSESTRKVQGSEVPAATTYNTGDIETPVAFAWTALKSGPAIAVATNESRLLVIDPANEKRLDAFAESTIAIAPGIDSRGRVAQWNALSATGRLVRVRNLTGETQESAEAPIEARLEQLTFAPRRGNWLWGLHNREPVTLCLAGLPTGETGVVVCNSLHQVRSSRPLTVLPEQARLLSSVRVADGTLYCLALGPNRVLHLFTADLQIMDQVSFDARIFGAALFADGQDLKLVVALEKEVSAWTIDVPERRASEGESVAPSGP